MQTENCRLDDLQLHAFLHSKGIPEGIVSYFASLPGRLGHSIESILDCGGGNGMYLDMLLHRFPEAEGVLVDSAQFMLDRNEPHPRKLLMLGNLENLETLREQGRKFDLICFSDVIHHCIVETYAETRQLQCRILVGASELLKPGGQMIVSERIMESWVTDGFSTRCVYLLTRSRLLARLTRLAGANTGGVGVCFMSNRQILEMFRLAGLTPVEQVMIEPPKSPGNLNALSRRLFLGVKSNASILYRLKKEAEGRE